MKNLICLPNVDFNHTWERQHEFMNYFSNLTEFMSSVVLPTGLVEVYNYNAIKYRLKNFRPLSRSSSNDVFCDQMAFNLIQKFDKVYNLGRHSSFLESTISSAKHRSVIKNLPKFDVCYFTYANIFTLDIAASANFSVLDLAEFRPANKILSRRAKQNELKAVEIADVVFCDNVKTLEFYCDLLPQESYKFHYLPQGVPEEMLRMGVVDPIEGLAPKVCCYLGNLHHAIDYDYLERLIDKNPKWFFKFCGRIYDDRALKIIQRPNCIYLGVIDKAEIGSFLSGASFGLIPYLVDEWTDGVSPTKYYEYLANGLNVVSTPIKEMARLESKYLTVNKLPINLDNVEFFCGSQAEASLNTWKARFDQVEFIIGDFL